MSIPKTIWQTYKSHTVPAAAGPYIQSWKEMNPTWKHVFCDDHAIAEFVRSNFSELEFETFSRLPLGVMRADFWRYAVLYTCGGVYADLDTSCRIPVETWADGSRGLVIGVEDTKNLFCQWVISAKPGHPVLRRAIDLIVERAKDDIDTSYPEFVHYHSGPALWTDAIRDYLELRESSVPRNQWNYPDDERRSLSASRIFANVEYWKGKDLTIHPWTMFCRDAVRHEFASQQWRQKPTYESWRQLISTL